MRGNGARSSGLVSAAGPAHMQTAARGYGRPSKLISASGVLGFLIPPMSCAADMQNFQTGHRFFTCSANGCVRSSRVSRSHPQCDGRVNYRMADKNSLLALTLPVAEPRTTGRRRCRRQAAAAASGADASHGSVCVCVCACVSIGAEMGSSDGLIHRWHAVLPSSVVYRNSSSAATIGYRYSRIVRRAELTVVWTVRLFH